MPTKKIKKTGKLKVVSRLAYNAIKTRLARNL